MERTNYASGSPLEEVAGYSRAVKVGNMIHVEVKMSAYVK